MIPFLLLLLFVAPSFAMQRLALSARNAPIAHAIIPLNRYASFHKKSLDMRLQNAQEKLYSAREKYDEHSFNAIMGENQRKRKLSYHWAIKWGQEVAIRKCEIKMLKMVRKLRSKKDEIVT